ncbi:MAG: hypothetical protein QNJ54_36585 [Prochloraceae cyanobacterium]|nr:hypothetical protein [Prochloraceae cyanobacterium]
MRIADKDPFPKRVFAAHSECDTTAEISGIEELQKVSVPNRFNFFRIPRHFGVSHASLVLKDPISKLGETMEKANPQFQEMMEAIAAIG